MRYSIEVLDSTRTRTAILSGLVNARLSEKINGRGLLIAETIEPSEWEHIAAGTSFLRVIRREGGSLGTFRVMETGKTRTRERISLTVSARHILFDTASELFANAISCVHYTPAELMELVLGFSAYTPGTVEPADAIPFVRFEYEPVLTCLQRICALTGGELAFDEENDRIDLLNHIGEDNGVCFRYGVNLRGASRRVLTSTMANRVYGVGGGDPPLTLDEAASSGGLPYAEDVDSIANFGLAEGVCLEPALERAVNLVLTPALDGVYADGLCGDWVKAGNPALSENTESDYLLYGKASQHVQATAGGQGIQQEIPVTPGAVYTLTANLFLVSGAVLAQIADGTSVYRRESPISGEGFASVTVENWKANASSVIISICQAGADAAEFFLDSVQVTESPRALPFTVGSSADTLQDRTVEYLNAHKNPEISYTIDLVDLYGDIRAGREADRFGLGDTVAVIDPTLGLNIATRVMERELDLLRPWQVSVRLDNSARSLADVLNTIREEQERGIRLQRASFAENSRTADQGSSRLGFTNTAFRFFGRITPTGWNSLSWTAGTLRAGIGHYAISSGNVSGFAQNTTYYFYFDRTAPTSFGYTTDAALAETEDRIHVFSVTTTTNPALCVIHPMGIIHD